MILPRITLPWTKTTDLSKNSRLHWTRQQPLKRAQKAAAQALALEAGWHRVSVPDGAVIDVLLTYCPPAGTVCPDGDNLVAANKSALDVLAGILRVDDRRFRVRAEPGSRCKSGAVIVDAEVREASGFRPVGDIAAGLADRAVAKQSKNEAAE